MTSALGMVCLAAVAFGLFLRFQKVSSSGVNPAPLVAGTPSIQETSRTTITICALSDHSFEVAIQLLRDSDFEERTGITVEAILLEFEPMERAHELNFTQGEANYDVVAIDQPSLGHYVTRGWVRPLIEFAADPSLPTLDTGDIVPVLREACGEWDQTLYAIPLGSYGALFAYRKDVLDEAGLSAPKTFAEFRSHAQMVNNPPDLYGAALFAHVGEYITADAAPFLWSWGAGLINGSDVNLPDVPLYRAAWDTPEGIAALEFYASLYRKGFAPPDTLEFDHERYIGAFQSGRIAMGIMPAEGVGAPMEDSTVSQVVGKIAYANLPGRRQADGSIGPPRPGLGAHSLAISSRSEHPREAYLVLQFLTGIQMGEEYIRRGGRPFRSSHFSTEAIEMYPYLEAIRDGMKTGRCRPNIPEYPAVSRIFFSAFHSALVHDAPIAEVMRAAAQKANEEVLVPAYPDATQDNSSGGADG